MTRPAQGGPSIVAYRLGGREYPLRTNANCRVCQSPYRMSVEEELAAGRPYTAIARGLPEDARLSAQNVSSHYHGGHLPFDVEVHRRILERRAEKVGRSIEEGVESLVDEVSLAEVVVQRTYERMERGEIEPDVADGIRAARLLAAVGQEGDTGDKAAWTEAFMVYFAAARRIMSAEQFAEFGAVLAANPILRALRTRAEGAEAAQETGQQALAG